MTPSTVDQSAEKETARVEAFSDGVFSIAITLLILEIRVPRDLSAAGLGQALLHGWPSYISFLLSFAGVGIMWLNHHRLFTVIGRTNHTLLMLNGVLLLTVTVMPFPTSLIAAYLGTEGATMAVAVYVGWSVLIATVYHVLWHYAASPKRDPPLLHVSQDHPAVRAIFQQYRAGPLWYLGAFAASFWSTGLALGLCAAFAFYFALPPKPPRGERT